MKYRTYKITGTTAYAKGAKMRWVSDRTLKALKRRGVQQIVWCNGDFMCI